MSTCAISAVCHVYVIWTVAVQYSYFIGLHFQNENPFGYRPFPLKHTACHNIFSSHLVLPYMFMNWNNYNAFKCQKQREICSEICSQICPKQSPPLSADSFWVLSTLCKIVKRCPLRMFFFLFLKIQIYLCVFTKCKMLCYKLVGKLLLLASYNRYKTHWNLKP